MRDDREKVGGNRNHDQIFFGGGGENCKREKTA